MAKIQGVNFDVTVFRYKNPATGDKWYTPVFRGQLMRLSWKRKTTALIYGKAVRARYYRLLLARNETREQDFNLT